MRYTTSKKIYVKGIIIASVVLFLVVGLILFNGQAFQRGLKSTFSNFTGGIDRTVVAYSYDGEELYRYSGKVDIENVGNKVLFDKEDGKRTVIYNAIVIADEN